MYRLNAGKWECMVLAPRWKTVTVEYPRKIGEQIRKQARDSWPKETIGFLLGRQAGTLYVVEDIWVPPDINASRDTVDLTAWHPAGAAEVAKNDDQTVLGAYHSHPRPFKDWGGSVNENTPSEGDHALGWEGICGIVAVIESKSSKLSTRLNFYAPNPPVCVKIIK